MHDDQPKDMSDSGSLYKETGLGRFPVEPFNTYSNFIFLFVALFWAVKLFEHWGEHPFLSLCTVLVLIGWFGGTMYHAKRNRRIWVMLDVYCIAFIGAVVACYFWYVSGLVWYWVLFGVIPVLAGALVIRMSRSPWGVPLGYLLIGAFSLAPIVFFLFEHAFVGAWYVVSALALLVAGLYFRSIDLKVSSSHGTHWLWHLCGGVAAQLLFTFIWLSASLR